MRIHYEDDRPKVAPGRKDTKRWCKGIISREHQFSEPIPRWEGSSWADKICQNCGKKELINLRPGESPWRTGHSADVVCSGCYDCLPCKKCGLPGRDCKGHRRKFPHVPMGRDPRTDAEYRQGTSYRK